MRYVFGLFVYLSMGKGEVTVETSVLHEFITRVILRMNEQTAEIKWQSGEIRRLIALHKGIDVDDPEFIENDLERRIRMEQQFAEEAQEETGMDLISIKEILLSKARVN